MRLSAPKGCIAENWKVAKSLHKRPFFPTFDYFFSSSKLIKLKIVFCPIGSDPVKILRCGKTVFPLKISSCWPCRPLKRPFCARGVRAWGHSCKILGWGHECKIFPPHLATFFFRRKEVFFWLRDHGKGLFVARGVRWWGHECQLLGVGSRVPTFCITSGDESAQRATSDAKSGHE